MAAKQTKAEKLEAKLATLFKGERKEDREKALAKWVPEPETRTETVTVEEPNEKLDEIKAAYENYRAGGGTLRYVEGLLRQL